ncbi:hypothetical protein [Desulfogranum japonicum]|uniref:hypothetical protein n=1 Tax=Desulfogranum japonicum TaxID=231447 RepID=UPI000405EB79|nr:hypothetical protein [Desulfogranum japonicum]
MTEQEQSVTNGIATVSYQAGNDGRQQLISGDMWQPVNIVNRQAWDAIEKQIQHTREKIHRGSWSCLRYYMVINHMDTGLLAKYSNQLRIVVYLHTLPLFFKRLGTGTLQKYADIFDVTVEDLQQGKLRAPVYGTEQGEEHAAC